MSHQKNPFLQKEWQKDYLKKVIKGAGPRYSPELNVTLPIGEIFDGISKSKEFYISTRKQYGKLLSALKHIQTNTINNKVITKNYDSLLKEINLLSRELANIKDYDIKLIAWHKINKHCSKSKTLLFRLIKKIEQKRKVDEKKKPDVTSSINNAIHFLYELSNQLHKIEELSTSTKAKLINNPFLLLTGLAGSGKTHLLCDIAEHRLNNNLPTILAYGENFNPSESIIKQLAENVDYPQEITPDNFLQLMDKAGKKEKNRSLIIIDALNENNNSSYWKKNLKHLVDEIKKYPNIALIISIRSGFEDSILYKYIIKLFTHETHQGFLFKEWEATKKFFKYFSLPLPEIPLLNPEFQNPLFLLLLCRAFAKKSNKKNQNNRKQIFRGHEGANYIFENFVKHISDIIAKKYSLPPARTGNKGYVIWDTIIEKIAEVMIKNNIDRICEDDLFSIIHNAHPTVNIKNFAKDLEKNLLLIKVPHYSYPDGKQKGFNYRFPFQKFSDHLLVRYLFKEFESSGQTAKTYFSQKSGNLKIISKTYNTGLVEALFIEIPERCKGKELFEIIPDLAVNSHSIENAFIQSLIWRNPRAFTKSLKAPIEYINENNNKPYFHDNFLDALITVAIIPKHPFNAKFLHKNLIKQKMDSRDEGWSSFLHYQHGEKNAVDRLIEWAWNHETYSKSVEPIKLAAIALTWFLSTPNAYIRDKSTKALVQLLSRNISLVIPILKLFKNVNDDYITERLYAAVYACVLKNSEDKLGLNKIARYIYNIQFKDKKPTSNILIRCYAKDLVDYVYQKKYIRIENNKIVPPYNTKWKVAPPSKEELKEKYYPKDFMEGKSKDRGFLGLWSSCMESHSISDFNKYNLDPAIGKWSFRKITDTEKPTKEIFNNFQSKLSETQKQLFQAYQLHALMNNIQNDDDKRKPILLSNFKESLANSERNYFEEKIEPFLNDNGQVTDKLEYFDADVARRYVFSRSIELGWSTDSQGKLDQLTRQGGRGDEKLTFAWKYQLIALHELLAQISDNFLMRKNDYDSLDSDLWQLELRDVDPTYTLSSELNVPTDNIPSFENKLLKKEIEFHKIPNEIWLQNKKSLPNPKQIIELSDLHKNDWLILDGTLFWDQNIPPEVEKYSYPRKHLHYILKSYLIDSKNFKPVFTWAKKQNYFGRWMPESYDIHNMFLGEYPYSRSARPHLANWKDAQNDIPAKILITDTQYFIESSSSDRSIGESSVRIKLPSSLLIEKMNLKHKYLDGRFFDDSGNLAAFDPSVFDKSLPNVLLFKKSSLISFLHKHNYAIFWTLLGEKYIVGDPVPKKWYGRQVINGAYTLNDGVLIGKKSAFFE